MYTCNITGNKFDLQETDKTREGALAYGYNSRFRAICYVLSKQLFNKVNILTHMDTHKEIKGIGMSDSGWASVCEQKFNYTNTYYHCEPFLDIYNDTHVNNYTELDFIISSDVFEHIDPYPGVQIAFNNLFKMLKSGGSLIFSVPFTYEHHIEHFPSLYKYTITKNNNNMYILENTRINGKQETFRNLCFHGGPGNVLEMRIYSKNSIIKYLSTAGFTDIVFHEVDADMNQYGIFWENSNSLIISAKKL